MPKFFVKNEQIKENNITILGQDVNHIKNVLREKNGNEIVICDFDEKIDYLCEILNINDTQIDCKIIEKLETNSESNIEVTIFQGLPKSDKMELVIQKSVELGAFDITPIEMKRCIVKLNDKEKNKKLQRWQKISEVAAKQCGRNIIPKINHIISLKNVVNTFKNYDKIIVAYEKENEKTLKEELIKLKKQEKEKMKIGIIIGPEGGIDEEEIKNLKENNVSIVTLGKRILRTETVALNVLSVIMYELEN